jgi:hypothetical protein
VTGKLPPEPGQIPKVSICRGVSVIRPAGGAAASSAGLAALGGGSLAAGGFGMAGGTAVITAAGAAFGAVVTRVLVPSDDKNDYPRS